MCNTENPIASETLKICKWYVEKFTDKTEVIATSYDATITIKTNNKLPASEIWLTSPEGNVYIIKMSTYEFPNIPLYVRRKLFKSGVLEEWRDTQTKNAYKRLGRTIETYRKFIQCRQDIPIEPEHVSITELVLPHIAHLFYCSSF
jgi:hypothetical protein